MTRDEAALKGVGPVGSVRVQTVGEERGEDFGVSVGTREGARVFGGACE